MDLDKLQYYCYHFIEGDKMKNYYYKYTIKGLALTLFLAVSSSLFAVSFNETRTVVVPQQSNAVYRSLNVLDKMFLEKDPGRIFLLELGKRPTYFWNHDKMFYLYQNPTVAFGEIRYEDSTDNVNILTVQNMNLNTGSFLSQNMFIGTDSTMSVSTSDARLFMGYNGELTADVTFGTDTTSINVYTNMFGFINGFAVNSAMKVDELYVRDLQFGSVRFPNPRMMVYQESDYYRAEGTAINFGLVNPSLVEEKPKSFYGAWELSGFNQVGRLTTGSTDPCPSVSSTSDRCYHIEVTCEGSKANDTPNCTDSKKNDTNDEIFICTGEVYKTQDGTYDPEGDCYDYQSVKNIANASSTNDLNNNNAASYEFKVEEIYQDGTTAELITQTPEFRRDGYGRPVPLMKKQNGAWSLNNVNSSVTIDGVSYTIANISTVTNGTKNACFNLCSGKLCQNHILYLRGTPKVRKLEGSPLSNTWPTTEGEKQNLSVRTYTLGFCPKQTGTNNYGNYELNYLSTSQNKLIEALKIKSGSNWVNPNVCMRRLVKCNKITGEIKYNRSYRLLSTKEVI